MFKPHAFPVLFLETFLPETGQIFLFGEKKINRQVVFGSFPKFVILFFFKFSLNCQLYRGGHSRPFIYSTENIFSPLKQISSL